MGISDASYIIYRLRAAHADAHGQRSGTRVFTAELADEFGLSRNHLSKIMQRLAHAEIVKTRRGGGGGAVLAQPADQLRLGRVIAVLEKDQPIVECFGAGHSGCSINRQCRLKVRLRSAEQAFLDDLDRSTLADIALADSLTPV